MFKIDSDGHLANEFTEGNPSLGQPATVVSAEWLNKTVQRELCNVVTSSGLALDKNDDGQLLKALSATKMLGAFGLGIFPATTTIANDSIVIKKQDGSNLSATNKGVVAIQKTTGEIAIYDVTANVTIQLTGAHFGFGTFGDVQAIGLAVIAINDNNNDVKFGVTLNHAKQNILNTNCFTAAASVVTNLHVLVNSAITAGTWVGQKIAEFQATFDDTGGAAEDLWAVQTGAGSVSLNQNKFATIGANDGWIAINKAQRIYLDGGKNSYITNWGMIHQYDFDSSTGVVYENYQNSASPAVNDSIFDLYAYGNDSDLNKTQYGRFGCRITDPTSAAENSKWVMSATQNGSTTQVFQAGSTATENYIIIPSASKFYLDGGSDTYISETSSNVISLFSSGLPRLRTSTNVSVLAENSLSNGTALTSYCDHASFASYSMTATTARASNAAFNLFGAYTADGADLEFKLSGIGNGTCDGAWTGGGADYAEYFESNTGLALEIGKPVLIDSGKVRIATTGETPIGVVRPKGMAKTSVCIGNDAELKWQGKYLKDEFGQYELENYDVYSWIETITNLDESTTEIEKSYNADNIPNGVIVPEIKTVTVQQRKKLNPAYDPEQTYIPRRERPEWNLIGLLGQVPIKKGEVVNPSWILMDSTGTLADIYFIK